MTTRWVLLVVAASVFGAFSVMPTALSQSFVIDSFEADGVWCPMAHCNRHGDSSQEILPLLMVGSSERVTDPRVGLRSDMYLGCCTGETFAVCAYSATDFPALVAFDYVTGAVKWTSPLEDLQGYERRRVNGILLAKMRVNGGPARRYVFAGNAREFVAYAAETGARIWRRPTTTVSPDGIGVPVSLSYSDAKELIAVTTTGWIVKLSPVNGAVIDSYRLATSVPVNGALYSGTFTTTNSPVVVGNTLYLSAEFKADSTNSLDPSISPVFVLRVDLQQPGVAGAEHRIKPIEQPISIHDDTPDRAPIGVRRSGGSPVALTTADGNILIIADARVLVSGRQYPAIAAVADRAGVLTTRWRAVRSNAPADDIRAAPALDQSGRVLLVMTQAGVSVFNDVDKLAGIVDWPKTLAGSDLVTCGNRGENGKVTVGSPIGFTSNPDTGDLVVYTNFQVESALDHRVYGYLGAFFVTVDGSSLGWPLWCEPLGLSVDGVEEPGPGTLGQPALFRYAGPRGEATGLIVNTALTGTYILRPDYFQLR